MNTEVDPRDEFLALLMAGMRPQEAAHAMGKTANYFRQLRNPLDSKYDKQFAADYEDVTEACRKYEAQLIRGRALCRTLGSHTYKRLEPDGPTICTRCNHIQ